jgi:ABC-type branched-subunit amino acid transport system substrate-binding protein
VTGVVEADAKPEEWPDPSQTVDVVFVAPSNLTVAATAAERIAAKPPRIAVFSTDFVLSDQLPQGNRQPMEGWYVIFNGDATPGEQGRFEDFARLFAARYGEQPSQYAANAYDFTAAVLQATGRVGPERGKIANEVLAGTFEAAIAGPLQFDPHGDVRAGHLTLYRLTRGEFVEQEELAVP